MYHFPLVIYPITNCRRLFGFDSSKTGFEFHVALAHGNSELLLRFHQLCAHKCHHDIPSPVRHRGHPVSQVEACISGESLGNIGIVAMTFRKKTWAMAVFFGFVSCDPNMLLVQIPTQKLELFRSDLENNWQPK